MNWNSRRISARPTKASLMLSVFTWYQADGMFSHSFTAFVPEKLVLASYCGLQSCLGVTGQTHHSFVIVESLLKPSWNPAVAVSIPMCPLISNSICLINGTTKLFQRLMWLAGRDFSTEKKKNFAGFTLKMLKAFSAEGCEVMHVSTHKAVKLLSSSEALGMQVAKTVNMKIGK